MHGRIAVLLFTLVSVVCPFPTSAQSINSGTVTGTVKDPSGAIVAGAQVLLSNPVTGYQQKTITDSFGTYRFNNIPRNTYRLSAEAAGFDVSIRDVDVRSSLPITADFELKVSGRSTKMNVTASTSLVETEPSTHQDVDRSSFLKLPALNPGN